MITSIRLLVLPAFVALAACASSPEPMSARDSDRFIDGLFERLDADGNAIISSEELEAARLAQFARIDQDGSGAISREEARESREDMQDRREARAERERDEAMRRAPEARQGGPVGDRSSRRGRGDVFSRMDSDGNGLISEREFPGRDSRLLDQADFDGDGNLTREELEDGMALLRDRRRRR